MLAGPPDTARPPTAQPVSRRPSPGRGETVHVSSDFTRDGGYAGMTELLALPARPQLVFAVNDVMAVGAMAAAREAGLSIPDDVAVAGFDDIVTLRDVSPS
ncbi:substrate-binding domain-containing protein [Oerskovia sp. M15]